MKPKNVSITAALAAILTAAATIAQATGAHITTSTGHTLAVGAILSAALTALHGAAVVAPKVKPTPKPKTAPKPKPAKPQHHAPRIILWIWDEVLDVTRLDAFVSAGVTQLAVKLHDGTAIQSPARTWAQWQEYCKLHRLELGAWGFIREANDGIVAGQLCKTLHPSFYIADVEVPFSQADVAYFTDSLRSTAGSFPLWLSSFGRIDLHPEIDWQQFAREGYHFMPQAYQCESLELTPELCLRACRQLFPHAQPTLGAYAGARGRIASSGLAASVRGLTLPNGVGMWREGTAAPADVTAIREALRV